MDKILLRQATREDQAAIRRLIHDVQINPTGLKWNRFLVAVTPENKLVGCGQIKSHTDGSNELASIAVREHARGRGISRMIIEKLLAQDDRRPLYLMCRTRLGPLYEKFGFQAIDQDEMPLYFQRISRAERIFNKNARHEDRLLIMRLNG